MNVGLEEEDNLLNAQNYYKKALILDETFKEAEDALLKLRKHMQVILYFLLTLSATIKTPIKNIGKGEIIYWLLCLILLFPLFTTHLSQ